MIAFTVSGQPRPKARPRVTRRGTFTPRRTRGYEAGIAAAARAAHAGPPLAGPLAVSVVAVFRRVRRLPGTGGREPHVVPPDLDNVVKAVLDGLQASRVIGDDASIVRIEAEKCYAASGEGPAVEVCVRALTVEGAP